MKRIGLKSFILLTVVLALLASAAYHHLFDVRRILSLQPAVLFLIGGLGSLASLVLSFFLQSGRESPFHLSWGDSELRPPGAYTLFVYRQWALCLAKKEERLAWELGPYAFSLIAGLGFVVLGLSILENRSLLLLEHFYHNFTKDYARVCPVEGDHPEMAAPQPEKYGCELVKKAYALGYAKELGDCAEDPLTAEAEVCLDRQWDEPTLHYSYRLVEKFMSGLVAQTQKFNQSLDRAAMEKETLALPDLSKSHAEGFIGETRNSYHIFTDLKAPGRVGEKLWRFLHPNHCQDAIRNLRFSFLEKGRDAGRQLEDALGHLLFNPALGGGADNCRPYTIHWESAPTVCSELLEDSGEALARLRLTAEVERVLERARLEEAFPIAGAPQKVEPKGEVSPPIAAVKGKGERPRMSFHCLITTGPEASSGHIQVGTHTFTVGSAILPKPGADGLLPHQSLMLAVAQAMAPGFSYNNLDRQMPLSVSEERFRQELARGGEALPLAKLEWLRFSDALAGDQWLEHYPRFMEVYPWQPHLAHFVSRFRRAYHQEDKSP